GGLARHGEPAMKSAAEDIPPSAELDYSDGCILQSTVCTKSRKSAKCKPNPRSTENQGTVGWRGWSGILRTLTHLGLPQAPIFERALKTPALFTALGARNQMTAEPSAMVQHPTAYRHDHPHVDPGALACPRSQTADCHGKRFHNPPPIGHARPRNLRITTEFSTSTALGSALNTGTPPGAIDHKVFAKYDIPEQERSSWSIFRVPDSAGRIRPRSTNGCGKNYLRRLLDTPDRLPNNQQAYHPSQVITSEHPLSGVSSTPVLPVLSEYEDEVDEYIPEESGTGSVTVHHLPPASTILFALSMALPAQSTLRAAQYGALWQREHHGSSFQDGSSLSSDPSHRPSLLHPLESTSGRTLESLHSRNPSPESAYKVFKFLQRMEMEAGAQSRANIRISAYGV
ncbi:hypothetical protein H4Q26_017941, partial [Puccinia striiformis f. sp. tritici PST-130]